MKVTGSNYRYWAALPVQAPDNFILEVEARSVSASPERPEQYGLDFRCSGQAGSRYFVSVGTGGAFSVALAQGGSWISWGPGGDRYSAAIKRDRGVNHLRLTARGDQFTLEINGVQVLTFRDSTLPRGPEIALVAATYPGDFSYAHVAFSNIRLYALP